MLPSLEALQRGPGGRPNGRSPRLARARPDIIQRSEAEADRIRGQERVDRGSVHEEADPLLAAGGRAPCDPGVDASATRAVRADGLVDSSTAGEPILTLPLNQSQRRPIARTRRDGVSADADPARRARQLFSDPETSDPETMVVRIEGLGEGLFADDEGRSLLRFDPCLKRGGTTGAPW